MRTQVFKATVLPALLAVCLWGCASDSVQVEHIVVEPRLVTFSGTDSVKTVSITHTCSCPFTWTDTVRGGGAWLTFAPGMSGDHTDVPVAIHRGLLTRDTTLATIAISTNAYGSDSIKVVAIK